ncbi:MAG: hypothetical protein HZB92_01670 [Euryarchaeota archaeon]|nr:hypothetical protein [Euryarchaeota archaeon]
MRLLAEGACRFYAQPSGGERGPGSRQGGAFYNPAMRHARDVTVALWRAVAKPGWTMLDGLASSGVRGLRVALEAAPGSEIVLNDHNPSIVRIIEKNIALNEVRNVQASCRNVNALLGEERFHYVDIDPFGTPVPYLTAALQGVENRGMLGFCATDVGVLTGSFKRVCQRRYMARPVNNECAHELALRILVGYAVRLAAAHDLAAEPITCYSRGHYLRCYMTVTRGVKRAEALMELMAHANFEPDGRRWISKHPEAKEHAGPLWAGNLFSNSILKAMSQQLSEHTLGSEKDLAIWEKEWGTAPLFYDTNIMARKFKASPPKLATLLEKLRGMGFTAQPTYFTPTGFKTDAQPEDMCPLYARNA